MLICKGDDKKADNRHRGDEMNLMVEFHDEQGPFHRTATLDDIQDFLEGSGLVACPLNPTVIMLDAGVEANGDESPTTEAYDIYKAMIAAAKESNDGA